MESSLFYIFAALALFGALGVLVQKKVIYSALSLIVCLVALSGIYMLLRAPFIAAVQIVVYAGAIMVLFLFVIMLIDPFSAGSFQDKRKYLSLAAVLLATIGLVTLFPMLRAYDPASAPHVPEFQGGGTVEHLGRMLFTDYLLPFEATSVLILIAIIGAVVLAKRQT